jgi:hypothetical protein
MKRYTQTYVSVLQSAAPEVMAALDLIDMSSATKVHKSGGSLLVLTEPGDALVHKILAVAIPGRYVNVWSHPQNTCERFDIESATHCLVGCGVQLGDADEIPGGDELGMPFDLSNACPNCRAGADQVGGMVLKTRGPKPKPSWVVAGSTLLLNEATIAPLRKIPGFDDCIRPAVTKKEGRPLTWYQLISNTVLPRLSGTGFYRQDTDGEGEHGCTRCDRGYWFLTRDREGVQCIGIDKPIESLPPVCMTWERWGNAYDFGNKRRIAPPMPVVCREIALRLFDVMGDEQSFLVPLVLKS